MNTENEKTGTGGMSVLQKLREDEREVRKNIIMDAAIKLLDLKLFHEVNMRDIADEAGLSVASIYKYFQNQEELFLEILIRSVRDILKSLEKDLGHVKMTIEDLAILLIDYCIANEAFFKISCTLMIRKWADPVRINKFIEFTDFFESSVQKILSGAGWGAFDKSASKLFIAAILGIFLTVHNDPELNREERIATMHDLAKMLVKNWPPGGRERA